MSDMVAMTGRAVANYRARGEAIPEGFPIMQCSMCGQDVTVSPGGAAKLEAHRAKGDITLVLCTPCVLVSTPPDAELQATPFGADLIGRSPTAKAVLDELLKRTGK